MSDQGFDGEIDDVAREMTRGGELPPDFRARVIARLDTGDERAWTLRPAWWLSPLAVAAFVLLAVLVVRAPWRSGGRVAQEGGHDAGGEVLVKPAPFVARDFRPAVSERIPSAEQPSVVRLKPDATYEGAGTSDLAPAPIRIESLDVQAMESMEVAPPSVDAMESIDVPRLDVARLEVRAIAE